MSKQENVKTLKLTNKSKVIPVTLIKTRKKIGNFFIRYKTIAKPIIPNEEITLINKLSL